MEQVIPTHRSSSEHLSKLTCRLHRCIARSCIDIIMYDQNLWLSERTVLTLVSLPSFCMVLSRSLIPYGFWVLVFMSPLSFCMGYSKIFVVDSQKIQWIIRDCFIISQNEFWVGWPTVMVHFSTAVSWQSYIFLHPFPVWCSLPVEKVGFASFQNMVPLVCTGIHDDDAFQ